MEKTFRMVSGRPNIDMAVRAASSEIFVLEFSKIQNLDNRLGMGQIENVKLVLLVQSMDNEVAAALGGNKQVAALTTNCH